tara:strand:- start:1751 stop:2065 length:315 start_codon:yes stop_codon:yes gene_type:complete
MRNMQGAEMTKFTQQDQQDFETLEKLVGTIVAVVNNTNDGSWLDWMLVRSVEEVFDADGTYELFALGRYYDGQAMDVYAEREATLRQIETGKIPPQSVLQKLDK